jgi:hypothetical protein
VKLKGSLLAGAWIAALAFGLLSALVNASPVDPTAQSTLHVGWRFDEHTFPRTRREPAGFLVQAEETGDESQAPGIRSIRVLVDRDLVPGWFDNPHYGVCTPAKVKGAYGLTQTENACGGPRLGGGFLARGRNANGHMIRFGAELFAARFDGQRGLDLNLYRVPEPLPEGGPTINLFGPVYKVHHGPFRWAFHLVVPHLKHRHDSLRGAALTRLQIDFDPDRHGAWMGRCTDGVLAFQGTVAIWGDSSPDQTKILKGCHAAADGSRRANG